MNSGIFALGVGVALSAACLAGAVTTNRHASPRLFAGTESIPSDRKSPPLFAGGEAGRFIDLAGDVTVDIRAHKKDDIDLSKYTLIFDEDFEQPLDVSAWGPRTRWIAHTPWNGDFGDAAFSDPRPGFPFVVKDGILRIEARKSDGFRMTDQWKRPWRSGLLASNDPKGQGFSLQYGYFEMRAKMPIAPGVWPAFWLVSSSDKTDPNSANDGSIEIDIVEYYGFKNLYNQTVHIWKPEPHRAVGNKVETADWEVGAGFHDYGALVTPENIIMYFDRKEVWRTDTPAEHRRPLMILLNLGLGGGWPIDKVPNPTFMEVDYVRAFALPLEHP